MNLQVTSPMNFSFAMITIKVFPIATLMKFLRIPLPGGWKPGTVFSQPFVHTFKDRKLRPTGTHPTYKCINSWLGKPSSGIPTSRKRYKPCAFVLITNKNICNNRSTANPVL